MRTDDLFGDMVPDAVTLWLADHPRVLSAAALGLLAFTAYNFYRAAELVVRSRDLVGVAQVAASERLGG